MEEGAEILRDQPVTRDEEAEWLERRLTAVAKGEVVWVVAEVDGVVIASTDLTPEAGHSQHIGFLGVNVKRGYRDIGVGTVLINALISHTKARELELPPHRLFLQHAGHPPL